MSGGELLWKWRAIERATLDQDLTALARRVLFLALEHMDRKAGGFGNRVNWVASKLGADASNVRGAFRLLVKRDYLECVKGAGIKTASGPANLYLPSCLHAAKDCAKKPRLAALDGEQIADDETRQKSPVLGGEGVVILPSDDWVKKPGTSLLVHPSKKEGGVPELVLPLATVVATKGNAASAKAPTKARAGCTIDSYWPGPNIAAWAAAACPLVLDPVSTATVEDIKDVWRKRGEKPKDFDATYRTYLRKRQEWATEKRAALPARSPPMGALAGSAEAKRRYGE